MLILTQSALKMVSPSFYFGYFENSTWMPIVANDIYDISIDSDISNQKHRIVFRYAESIYTFYSSVFMIDTSVRSAANGNHLFSSTKWRWNEERASTSVQSRFFNVVISERSLLIRDLSLISPTFELSPKRQISHGPVNVLISASREEFIIRRALWFYSTEYIQWNWPANLKLSVCFHRCKFEFIDKEFEHRSSSSQNNLNPQTQFPNICTGPSSYRIENETWESLQKDR